MKKITLLICSFLATISTHAIPYSDLWTTATKTNINVEGNQKIIPSAYILAKLNTQTFSLFQSVIPTEESGLYANISLPTPTGASMNFRIMEVPMMEKPLADKYPQIKTYTAISIDHPWVTAKIDFTVFGFHAMVFNGNETYLIDPYTDLNTDWYICYYKKDFHKPFAQRMSCIVDEEKNLLPAEASIPLNNDLPTNSYKTNGTNKRTYRLALACTTEYSDAVGGATPTKASVLSAMVTSMNRVNGVFEKDFAMHANLVANNDTLIFLSSAGTDPYTNTNGSTMLGQNQTTLTARIGSANYDYGHVFSTGGGGVASLGCVCNSNSKAQGVTGSSSPVGDPYDIDYVAHEMGHQFGGSHTFNSVTGSCNGNRSSTSAFEIGSATTIMGYAGICGSDDIQQHSDDYYHIRSLEQMTGTSVMACATNTASNNTLPVLASISKTYTIPYRTSFELTASGTDADSDPLTYCWEEYDRGGSGSAWNAGTTVAPILRSFNPTTSPTRTFPAYIKLIQNVESYLGERLPDTARTLRFRCTLRDLHLGYGGFYTSTDTTKLTVVSTSPELFRVTSQNTAGQIWNAYSSQNVVWTKANTDIAPVSCNRVDIYLSIDSGKTWPYLLASSVPNTGSATILVPNVAATWARIKVKGNGNVFFDLNDQWITLVKAPVGISDISENAFQIFPNPAKDKLHVEFPSNISNISVEILSDLGAVVYSNKQLQANQNIDLAHFASGIYFMKIQLANGKQFVKKLSIE